MSQETLNNNGKGNLFFKILKMTPKEIEILVPFCLMLKETFTSSTVYYLISFFLRFFGIFIVCGDFLFNREDINNRKNLSNFLRNFSSHKIIEITNMNNMKYNISCCFVCGLIIIQMIFYIITLYKIKKRNSSSLTIYKMQTILDHITFFAYPFILEYLSFIIFIYVFPNTFAIKKDSNCDIFNIIICLLNIFSLIGIHIMDYFRMFSLNDPLNDDNYPIKYNVSEFKFIICFIMQDFIIIESCELYLSDSNIKIYKIIVFVINACILIILFLFSIRNFNYTTSVNILLDILANFSFISIIFECALYIFKYKILTYKVLALNTIVKILLSILFEIFSFYINDRFLMNVIKTELFKINKHIIEDKVIFHAFNYFYEKIKYLNDKTNINLHDAPSCLKVIFKHEFSCSNPECKCKLIHIFPYGKSYLENFNEELINRIGFLIETAFVQLNYIDNFEMCFILAEHYYHGKKNVLISYSMVQSLLSFSSKNLTISQKILILQAQKKYIEKLEIMAKIKITNKNDMSEDNIELIKSKKQEVYFEDMFFTLKNVKKIYKQMNLYTKNYITILKSKERFEGGVKLRKDKETNEILYIENEYLTSNEISNIIKIVEDERKTHIQIVQLLKELKGKKLYIEFYYKCFVFVELFLGGKIDENLVPILYSFTNDRNLYSTNLNPSVFIVLKQRYLDQFYKNISKHYIIFTFADEMRISYFSETLSFLLKYKQEELLKQNISILFPDSLVKPHNNLLLSFLINNQNNNFSTIHNYIFDKDNCMLSSKFLGLCQPGLNKNLITIIELELIDINNQYLAMFDSNFNLISLSRNFDENYTLSLQLMEKYNINLFKIFDIPQNALQSKLKKHYKKSTDYRHYLELRPGEHFIKRLFKSKTMSSKISKFLLIDEIEKISKNGKSDLSFMESLRKIKNDIENLYNKDNHSNMKINNKFVINRDKRDILNNFIKLAEQYTEVDLNDHHFRRFNEFIFKITQMISSTYKAGKKGQKERKNIYDLSNVIPVHEHADTFFNIEIYIKDIYDKCFIFVKMKEFLTGKNNMILNNNDMSMSFTEKDRANSTLSGLTKNDESLMNKSTSLIRTTTKTAIQKRNMALATSSTSENSILIKMIIPITIGMICLLLVLYIILMFYQDNMIEVDHMIFLVLFYNYYQRDKFFNLFSSFMSHTYYKLNLTKFDNNLLTEKDIIDSIVYDSKEFEKSYHYYYNNYITMKLKLDEPLTSLYHSRELRKISISFNNINYTSEYLAEVEFISFLSHYSAITMHSEEILKDELLYFFHGKFLADVAKGVYKEVKLYYTQCLYYLTINFSSFFLFYYSNLQNDIELKFDEYTNSSNKIYILLEVFGFLFYMVFFLIMFLYLKKMNLNIFANILNMFIDYTQEGNYNFNNHIDNYIIAKKLTQFGNLLTNFNVKTLDSYNKKLDDKEKFEDKSLTNLTATSRTGQKTATTSIFQNDNFKTKKNKNKDRDKERKNNSKIDNSKMGLKEGNDVTLSTLNADSLQKKNRLLSNLRTIKNSSNSSRMISTSNNELLTNNSFLTTESQSKGNKYNEDLDKNIDNECTLPAEAIASKIKNSGVRHINFLYLVTLALCLIVIIYFVAKLIISLDFSTYIKGIFNDFGSICYRSSVAYEYFNNLRILLLVPQFGNETLFDGMMKELDDQSEKVTKILNEGLGNYPKTEEAFSILLIELKVEPEKVDYFTEKCCDGYEMCIKVLKSKTDNIYMNGIRVTLNAILQEIQRIFEDFREAKKDQLKSNDVSPELIRKLFINSNFEKIDLDLTFVLKHLQQFLYTAFKQDEQDLRDNFIEKITVLNTCAIVYCALIGILVMIFVVSSLKSLQNTVENSSSRVNKSFCYIKINEYEEIERTKTAMSMM